MFWHCRLLKYVHYDKVYPCPIEKVDEDFARCYKWLGKYCSYYPQIWLSQCDINMTGYHRENDKWFLRNNSHEHKNDVLFGFDIVKGFPVDYEMWCSLITGLMNKETIEQIFDSHLKWEAEDFADDPIANPISPHLVEWRECRNVNRVLNKYLFAGNDQFVVPSLNLKTAKRVICRNDHVRKTLRKMGFIGDRLEVRKML